MFAMFAPVMMISPISTPIVSPILVTIARKFTTPARRTATMMMSAMPAVVLVLPVMQTAQMWMNLIYLILQD